MLVPCRHIGYAGAIDAGRGLPGKLRIIDSTCVEYVNPGAEQITPLLKERPPLRIEDGITAIDVDLGSVGFDLAEIRIVCCFGGHVGGDGVPGADGCLAVGIMVHKIIRTLRRARSGQVSRLESHD